jgi:hypothetical protein
MMRDESKKWFIPEHIWYGILTAVFTLVVVVLTHREYSEGATKWRLLGGVLMAIAGTVWSVGHFANVNHKRSLTRRIGRIILWVGLGLLVLNRF